MKNYEVKDFAGKDAPFDVDDKTRRVKVALNRTGVKDSDDDVIERSAFDKTIRERGPIGKNLIWHLTDHNPSLKHAVGKFSELFMEGEYLVGITDIAKTSWGNDVLELYKSGTINQHSIGFRVKDRQVVNEDDPQKRYCVLKEIFLYEGSAVLWGANEYTPTLEIPKSLTERQSAFDRAMSDLTTLHKMFKSGHLTDETYELLEIKILQLTEKLKNLFGEATLAAQKAQEPAEDEAAIVKVLETFYNNH